MERRQTKRLTYEDRQFIEKCIKEYTGVTEICRQLNRHVDGVHREIRRNGGKQNYTAENAQKRYDKVIANRGKHVRATIPISYKGRISRLEESVSALDMQIEILHEQIKRILDGHSEN